MCENTFSRQVAARAGALFWTAKARTMGFARSAGIFSGVHLPSSAATRSAVCMRFSRTVESSRQCLAPISLATRLP